MSLEGVFRSSALLEHLDAAATQDDNEPTRIKINQGKKKLWFEVSCSRVQSIYPEGTYSTLLVMHDITKQKTWKPVDVNLWQMLHTSYVRH